MLSAVQKIKSGISSRRRIRQPCYGPLSNVIVRESQLRGRVQPQWGGAEHNMNPHGDDRLEVEVCLNWACDLLAKKCAQSDRGNELDYHDYWGPLKPTEAPPYYFTDHGRAWSEEPFARARMLAGAACLRHSRRAPASGVVYSGS